MMQDFIDGEQWIRMSSSTSQIAEPILSSPVTFEEDDCLSPLPRAVCADYLNTNNCTSLNDSLKRSLSMNESVEILRNDIMRSITLQAYPHGVPSGKSP